MIEVLGLDLSLTSTGVAVARSTFVIASKLSGLERIHSIAKEITGLANEHDVVVIEGYAFSAHGKYTRETAELAGVVKYQLWLDERPFALVAPATLKKFATGKGGGGKAGVAIAAAQHAEFDGHTSDEADAFFLRQMGVLAYSPEPDVLDPLPRHQREALRAVVWPALREVMPSA